MPPIVVVGSGASAVHFALTVLARGREVVMLDVGRHGPPVAWPELRWADLRSALPDPVSYFLGERFESVLLPDNDGEYYGLPPGKDYVVSGLSQSRHRSSGFEPLESFASGGLAEVWTAGVYPFDDADLDEFPFDHAALAPFYDLVARRIGVSGEIDDLARHLPVHEHLQPPLPLDEHSQRLLAAYQRRRRLIDQRLRCRLGRSRLAVLTRDREGRSACARLGRCLWGCPSGALYTPSSTLAECRRYPRFRYRDGVFVHRFEVDRERRVEAVVFEDLAAGRLERISAQTVVLAAGTLSSSRIFLDSIRRATGEIVRLEGLMDNRQILVPFVTPAMIGRAFDPDSYQYHQLCLGLRGEDPRDYVHGQITTLKTALVHPIAQRLPFDLTTSLRLFGDLHAALGLVNVNLGDHRRRENVVTIEPRGENEPSTLVVDYRPATGERRRIREATRRVRRVLRALGCRVPPGLSHVRPMGASVHYAGLLPMASEDARWTTTADCESVDFRGVHLVDGSTFPRLPAKNLTFTLMANATRVAERVA